ncbi:DUF4868 domain-containing protein [Acidithiobacillus ferriphilus]|uniref:DUF4868 domain-containing protein n=1 Tax=Acidithiobacillus ferriphilus TaxID=1689834 RepID=UPI001C06B142|nr:DUF4868 domain-containing protein [Acidithiobacillus ferriphilus]MBU2827009.1 DUF4868 domain-containing protein [Acidithiobacillus ferriphilus]
MQLTFESLRAFNFTDSTIHLWVFKRSSTNERFSARYAQTDGALNALLLGVVQAEMNRITEFSAYTHLSQTNENSCLAEPIAGSDFVHLKAIVDRPEPDWRVRTIKDLKNASGYLVKFTHNGQVVYAVKRSATNWKTSYLKTHINIVFNNGELSAAEDNGFAIEKSFDFYAHGAGMFIASKGSFEAAMEHRTSYAQAFADLQLNGNFSGLFTDVQPLVRYVGTNAIQLRRMARVEERALFSRPDFLAVVQAVNGRRGWGLNFDANTGRLVPCDQTAKTIMQILLDHRLLSEVTEMIYDVPDATQV